MSHSFPGSQSTAEVPEEKQPEPMEVNTAQCPTDAAPVPEEEQPEPMEVDTTQCFTVARLHGIAIRVTKIISTREKCAIS